MSPRPFERPATIALPDAPGLAPGASLEGLWLPARDEALPVGGAVVAPPHPLMGGSMDSPVTTELALATSDAGYASLRFNWRGVGASAGTASGEADDSDADYRAAWAFLDESVEGPLLACGYSWGALAAARMLASDVRVKKLILVAPPAAMLDAERIAEFDGPILVIVGDRDEYVPLEPLREVLAGARRAELVELGDVDHFFMAGLAELAPIVRDFLRAGLEAEAPA